LIPSAVADFARVHIYLCTKIVLCWSLYSSFVTLKKSKVYKE